MSSEAKRDDWMLEESFPFGLNATESSSSRSSRTGKTNACSPSESKISSREINSVLRKQLAGEQTETSLDRHRTADHRPQPQQSMDWTVVLVKRAIKMVESGEKTLEQVAFDRFGSIEEFEKAVRDVERYKKIRLDIRIPSANAKDAETSKCQNRAAAPDPVIDVRLKEDINKLSARKMKAELAGDFEAARILEEQILGLRKDATTSSGNKLTLLPSESYSKRKSEKDMSIAELVRHEKLSSRREFDQEFESGITGNKRFRDGIDDLDDQLEKRIDFDAGKSSSTFDPKRMAVSNYQKLEKHRKECPLCPESERFAQEKAAEWVIAHGNYCYLAVPKRKSLDHLHCLIVPMSHICSFLDCNSQDDDRGGNEEAVWEEMRNFKKCLLQLAASRDRSYVFIECVTRVPDSRRHTFIDCIPTPRGHTAEDVRGHFYKWLQEGDEEWSQHRKTIDTSSKPGGLRASIPRSKFPYFYVDFRLDQGYAHIIEDPEKFGGGEAGRELMASILGVSRHVWRESHVSVDERSRFARLFAPFDWTKALK